MLDQLFCLVQVAIHRMDVSLNQYWICKDKIGFPYGSLLRDIDKKHHKKWEKCIGIDKVHRIA